MNWIKRKRRSGLCLLIVIVMAFSGSGLWPAAKAAAAIAYISKSTASSTATVTAQNVSAPSGMAAQEVEIAQVTAYYNHPGTLTITPPSGWSAVDVDQANGRYNQQSFYHAVGTTEPTSYTFSFSGASYVIVNISVYSGVNSSAPIDTDAELSDASSTTQTFPVVSPSFNGDMLVPLMTYNASTTAATAPGLTQLYSSATTNIGDYAGYVIDPNTGNSPSYSTTTAAATSSLAQTIALAPTGASVGVQLVADSTPAVCTNCSSLSITSPSGWSAGDLLITSVTWNTSGVTLTAPAGWTLIGAGVSSGGYTLYDYYRLAQAGDPSSYSWTFSGATQAIIGESSFSGVDPAQPLDNNALSYDTSGTSHTLPTFKTSFPDDGLVGVWAYEAATTTSTFPGGMISDWNAVTSAAPPIKAALGSSAAHQTLGNAGTTPTDTAVSGSSTVALMQSIALKANLPLPSLLNPTNNLTDVKLKPTFQLVNASLDGGPLEYKINICSDATCSTIVTTYDQTLSQTGWSGQNANSGTAYVGGSTQSGSTIASYTPTSPLAAGTQYWWRGFSYQVNSGTWGISSNIHSFTTSHVPSVPTLIEPINGATDIPVLTGFKLASTDSDGDPLEYKIDLCQDSACATVLATWDETATQNGWSGQDSNSFTAYASDPTNYLNSTPAYYNIISTTKQLTPGTTYYWQAFAINPTGSNIWSGASAIDSFTINTYETRILNGVIQSGSIL